MLMEDERYKLVKYGVMMNAAGLTKGTSGNLSIYDADKKMMAITPSGISYLETTIEDIVIMDLDGNVIEGTRKPSSEHSLHATIYKLVPTATSVVHAHSTYCSTLACMRVPIEATHYLLACAQTTTIPCAKYATFGTPELANTVKEAMNGGLALLLANHGMVAWGDSIESAFNVATNVEWVAEIQWRCMCAGNYSVLTENQIGEVIDSFKTYGQDSSDTTKGY